MRAQRTPSTRCRVLRSGWGTALWDSRSESGVDEGLRDMLALMQAVPREVMREGWACVEFGTFAKDRKRAYMCVIGEVDPAQRIKGKATSRTAIFNTKSRNTKGRQGNKHDRKKTAQTEFKVLRSTGGLSSSYTPPEIPITYPHPLNSTRSQPSV